MKRVYVFWITAMVCLSFGFMGCVEEDPAKPLDVNSFQTATLTGNILIKRGTVSQAPHNMSVDDFIVSVDYSSFKIDNQGKYYLPKAGIRYVASSGEFIITVPVGNEKTMVYIDFSDFYDVFGESDEVLWKASKSGTNVLVEPDQRIHILEDIIFLEY